jgi:hypothetical protein
MGVGYGYFAPRTSAYYLINASGKPKCTDTPQLPKIKEKI